MDGVMADYCYEVEPSFYEIEKQIAEIHYNGWHIQYIQISLGAIRELGFNTLLNTPLGELNANATLCGEDILISLYDKPTVTIYINY